MSREWLSGINGFVREKLRGRERKGERGRRRDPQTWWWSRSAYVRCEKRRMKKINDTLNIPWMEGREREKERKKGRE